MSSLDKAMKELKFDKRLTELNLRNGTLTKEELKKHIDELPDLGNKVDLVSLTDNDDIPSDTH